jgi:hypothetical protein
MRKPWGESVVRTCILFVSALLAFPALAQETPPPAESPAPAKPARSREEILKDLGAAGNQYACARYAGAGARAVVAQREAGANKRKALRSLPAETAMNSREVQVAEYMMHVGYDHPELSGVSIYHVGFAACMDRTAGERPKLPPEKISALVACQAIENAEAREACYRPLSPGK